MSMEMGLSLPSHGEYTPKRGLIMNKALNARDANKARYLKNSADCGRFGRAFELKCARIHSRKTSISKQGQVDIHVKFVDDNGKAYYVPCEVKTNGGRIDELLNGSKTRYVIYDLHFVQKHKATKKYDAWEEHRDLDQPVIIPKALFLAKLAEFGIIKTINRNGEFDGYGIQVSSKKWFEWLSDYPVKFDNENAYEEWEFEGLE